MVSACRVILVNLGEFYPGFICIIKNAAYKELKARGTGGGDDNGNDDDDDDGE